jgi:hypothetical protein
VEREKERDLREDFNVGGRINIKMELRETVWGFIAWIHLT